jgi:hypothetical protein
VTTRLYRCSTDVARSQFITGWSFRILARLRNQFVVYSKRSRTEARAVVRVGRARASFEDSSPAPIARSLALQFAYCKWRHDYVLSSSSS